MSNKKTARVREAVTRQTLLVAALAAVGVLAEAPAQASGDEIVVIVNKANAANKLSQSDLRPIFQTTKTSWASGEKILALNLPGDSAPRVTFDRSVLGMDASRVEQYWTDRKIRGGERPPAKLPSPAVVAKVVASKSNAIGYVPRSAVPAGAKIVAVIRGGRVE